MPKYLKRKRECTTGRSLFGDFMDDDLNERIYGLLLDAGKSIEQVLDILHEHAGEPSDNGQSYFEIGMFTAAQQIIEGEIDEDYTPLKEEHDARMNKRLLRAIESVKK